MANVYTDVGIGTLPGYINKVTSLPANFYISAGTGAGGATGSSTALSTEVAESRVTTTNFVVSTTKKDDTSVWQATQTYSSGTPKTITNAGVFDASTSGALIVVADSISIAVNNGDSIQFTFKLKQS